MNTGILRDPQDKYSAFGATPRVMSLLDILGGGRAVCDQCGRWQEFSALSAADAARELAPFGWKHIDGKDICSKCDKASGIDPDTGEKL